MKQIILKVKDETHKAARIKALMLDKSYGKRFRQQKRAITLSLATYVIARNLKPVNPGITLYCKGFRQKLQGGICNAEFNGL